MVERVAESFGQTFRKLLCLILLAGFARSAVYNAACLDHNQCQAMYTFKYNCEQNRCIRQQLELSSWETSGYAMIFFLTMVTNAAGIGGGAIMVPVFIYMFDFASIESIPLSKITMLAGAIANLVLTYHQRVPNKPGYLLIDLAAAAAFTPLMLAGTQIGVLLQKWLPPALVMACLTALVIYTLIRMFRSAVNAFEKESLLIQKLEEAEIVIKLKEKAPLFDIEQSLHVGQSDQAALLEKEPTALQIEHPPSLYSLYKPHCINLLILCASIMIVIFAALFRGGEATSSLLGVERCSNTSLCILLISQLLNVILAFAGYTYNETRGLFNPEIYKLSNKLVVVLLYSYAAGVAAGLFGLGGGLVLGVYMISIGLNPEYTTALTGFTLLWVASSTSVQYAIIGAVHMTHAGIFMAISLIGSFIGNIILRWLVRKFNRPSILIWVIFFIMIISGIVIPYDMVIRSIKNPNYALTFNSYC